MRFQVETFLNQNRPAGGTRADAVFSLSADSAAPR